MNIPSLLLCAVALSMDAFAVGVCKGLSIERITLPKLLTVGFWFGAFQALMPTLGYLLATLFAAYVAPYSCYIAFALLLLIGINMIKESLSKEEDEAMDDSLDIKTMLLLAVATSIDALAVGVAYRLDGLSVPLFAFAAAAIGVVTFLLSAVGVKVGNLFGAKYKSRAEMCGGIVLCLLGLKILLEGLGVITLPF